MKFDWRIMKFSEFAEFNPKEHIKKGVQAKKVPMDVLKPFCRDISEYLVEPFNGGTKFRNEDTIMARITPCLENGKISMINFLDDGEIGFGSTEYIVFRAKDNITDSYFLYYLVCSQKVREQAIKSMVGSSGRQRVQTDVVKKMEIRLPSLNEQKKIANILKLLDDKIAINNKINDNLTPHPHIVRIAAKQRRRMPKPAGCLHTAGKVSGRGVNEETAEQFSSLWAA